MMVRALILMFGAGAIAALSMPDSGVGSWNFNFAPWSFPVFALSFGLLFLKLRTAPTSGRAGSIAYFWGLGYFTAGLSWVGNALLIDGNPYAWAYPFALLGLPALLSLFHAVLFSVGHRLIKTSHEETASFIFVALFTISELARGHLFTGFPWLLPGMYWSETPFVFHGLAIVGIYGLTLFTVFVALSFFLLLIRRSRSSVVYTFISLLLFGGLFAYDVTDKKDQEGRITKPLQVVLVQANIPQAEKWEGDRLIDHFYTHLTLSKRNKGAKNIPTVIIWPETALPPSFLEAPVIRNQITALLGTYPPHSVLITGALRAEQTGGKLRYYNSAVMFDANGNIIGTYDKTHLVPFGEYVPFQKYIPIGPIAGFEGLEPGPGPVTLRAPDIPPFTPLICYEVIFPGLTRGLYPSWLMTLTNDSWYGDTAGPRQHLALARARAIETGRPMVRVAGTGISAVIDHKGKIIAHMDYGTTGVLTTTLSPPDGP